MTKQELESHVRAVAEHYDSMEKDKLSLYRRLTDLEHRIFDIKNQMVDIQNEIFALHDRFNNGILPVGGGVLMKNYYDFGFGSDVVRDCVSVVRKLFFDDSDYDFKKMDCIGIGYAYLHSHVGLTFTFYDGKRMLDICFVTAIISNHQQQYDIFHRGDCVGESQPRTHPYSDTVMKDITGSVEVSFKSDSKASFDSPLNNQPTRDFRSVRKFVHDVLKRKCVTK